LPRTERLAHVVGLGKRDHPRHAEDVAAGVRGEGRRHLDAARERVEVAPCASELGARDDGEHPLVGVAVVDDRRQAGRRGDSELGGEDVLLHVAWGVVVVEVESALPHRDGARMGEESAQALLVPLGPARRLVRMDAEGAPDALLRLGEGEQILRLLQPHRRNQEAPNSALPRALQRAQPFVVREVLQVAMRVDQHARARAEVVERSIEKASIEGAAIQAARESTQ